MYRDIDFHFFMYTNIVTKLCILESQSLFELVFVMYYILYIQQGLSEVAFFFALERVQIYFIQHYIVQNISPHTIFYPS
jgi:hypothetical protein